MKEHNFKKICKLCGGEINIHRCSKCDIHVDDYYISKFISSLKPFVAFYLIFASIFSWISFFLLFTSFYSSFLLRLFMITVPGWILGMSFVVNLIFPDFFFANSRTEIWDFIMKLFDSMDRLQHKSNNNIRIKEQREYGKKAYIELKKREIIRQKEKEERKKKQIQYKKNMKSKGYLSYKSKWGTPEQIKGWKEIDIGLDNNFAKYNPYEFEKLIAKLFSKMGYSTKITPKSGDFGADVIAEKDDSIIAIQVKLYGQGNLVGNQDVQKVLGSMWRYKANQSIIITTSRFTIKAREQSKDAPVELWNKKILHEMIRKYFIDNESKNNIKSVG